jgi:predicted acylesterase/phospholipase RssA
MDKQGSLNLPVQYWYGRPGAIEHLFYGVFEGGGAKGVAYAGALLAMAERKCWFRAVAGASAGAITAALVASALPPEAQGS